jgi:hypothetical protein
MIWLRKWEPKFVIMGILVVVISNMSLTETIIFYCFLGGVILFLLIKAFWIRRCDNDRTIMKIKIDEDNGEIIYQCPVCERIKRTGIFGAGSD